VESFCASVCCENGDVSGDVTKCFASDHRFIAALSDGMGTGRIAHKTAAFAVDFLEKICETGCSHATALALLNHILRGREEECSTTVDMFEFDPQNLRAGVGIIVAPPYRKQGFALDALQTLERYIRDVLRMHQLWCSVGADNEASLVLFKKAGYAECGCRKEWILTPNGAIDEVLMQKIL
jgi:diamine N-acetyltransferase